MPLYFYNLYMCKLFFVPVRTVVSFQCSYATGKPEEVGENEKINFPA